VVALPEPWFRSHGGERLGTCRSCCASTVRSCFGRVHQTLPRRSTAISSVARLAASARGSRPWSCGLSPNKEAKDQGRVRGGKEVAKGHSGYSLPVTAFGHISVETRAAVNRNAGGRRALIFSCQHSTSVTVQARAEPLSGRRQGLSAAKSAGLSMPRSAPRHSRARCTRLRIVPTGQSQACAASWYERPE
jgi:hypothetical protein